MHFRVIAIFNTINNYVLSESIVTSLKILRDFVRQETHRNDSNRVIAITMQIAIIRIALIYRRDRDSSSYLYFRYLVSTVEFEFG